MRRSFIHREDEWMVEQWRGEPQIILLHIGAQWRAWPEVLAVVGDGGFQMTGGELSTAMIHKLPVKILIIDNKYRLCPAVAKPLL